MYATDTFEGFRVEATVSTIEYAHVPVLVDAGGTVVAGDIIEADCADQADRAAMAEGCHYDYRAQTWRDGHDHAHYLTDESPLLFCGADVATCCGRRELVQR